MTRAGTPRPRLDAPGTPESVWRAWDAPPTWPTLALTPPGRAVVACPHPDDETLAIGGTLHLMALTGWRITVVAVTDGDQSHPPTPERDAAALAVIRRGEQRRAVAQLGVDPSCIRRLGIRDTRVLDHIDAVTTALTELTAPGDWLLAPWEHDGHRDHDATGRAARAAAPATGARLLAYPLWAWHWTTPDHPALASWRPLRIDLDATALRAKRQAIAAYPSQTTGPAAIVPPAVLERHLRHWEVLLS